ENIEKPLSHPILQSIFFLYKYYALPKQQLIDWIHLRQDVAMQSSNNFELLAKSNEMLWRLIARASFASPELQIAVGQTGEANGLLKAVLSQHPNQSTNQDQAIFDRIEHLQQMSSGYKRLALLNLWHLNQDMLDLYRMNKEIPYLKKGVTPHIRLQLQIKFWWYRARHNLFFNEGVLNA
ncbi:MAG: hypothetical protein AAF403_03725, partial [Pseudomonadota bacterium]